MAVNGGYDLYNLVGRKYEYANPLDDIFRMHYFAVAERYILPCRGVADVVLRKGEGHRIEGVEIPSERGRRWDQRCAVYRDEKLVRDVGVIAVIAEGCPGPPGGKGGAENYVDLLVADSDVTELTRAWGGGWVLALTGRDEGETPLERVRAPTSSWLRAAVVVRFPGSGDGKDGSCWKSWAEKMARPRGGGCPWDGVPGKVARVGGGGDEVGLVAKEIISIGEMRGEEVLVLGMGSTTARKRNKEGQDSTDGDGTMLERIVKSLQNRGYSLCVGQRHDGSLG